MGRVSFCSERVPANALAPQVATKYPSGSRRSGWHPVPLGPTPYAPRPGAWIWNAYSGSVRTFWSISVRTFWSNSVRTFWATCVRTRGQLTSALAGNLRPHSWATYRSRFCGRGDFGNNFFVKQRRPQIVRTDGRRSCGHNLTR